MEQGLHKIRRVAGQWLPVMVAFAGLFAQPMGYAKPSKLPPPTSVCETTSLCQPVASTASGVRVAGALPTDKEVVSLLQKLASLNEASNKHSLDGVLAHFSPAFVSGDHLTLAQVRQLIEQTWAMYPDIRYQLQPVEVRLNGHWATVETIDEVHATAKADGVAALTPKGLTAKTGGGSDKSSVAPGADTLLPSDQGELVSRSRGMLYLHRVGKSWEITSDRTLYETAAILFGSARNVSVALSAPDQVFSGQTYTAQLSAQLPEDMVAIASVTKEPIQAAPGKPQEKFRSLTVRKLERVFEANTHDHNELITATVGLTRISQDAQNRPVVTFEGLATLTKRVNVASSRPDVAEVSAVKDGLVKVSANGKIDLRIPESSSSASSVQPAEPSNP